MQIKSNKQYTKKNAQTNKTLLIDFFYTFLGIQQTHSIEFLIKTYK